MFYTKKELKVKSSYKFTAMRMSFTIKRILQKNKKKKRKTLKRYEITIWYGSFLVAKLTNVEFIHLIEIC